MMFFASHIQISPSTSKSTISRNITEIARKTQFGTEYALSRVRDHGEGISINRRRSKKSKEARHDDTTNH